MEVEGIDVVGQGEASVFAAIKQRLGKGATPTAMVEQVAKQLQKYLGWYR
jgi:hypothetical protein